MVIPVLAVKPDARQGGKDKYRKNGRKYSLRRAKRQNGLPFGYLLLVAPRFGEVD